MPFMAADGEADASGWEAEPGRTSAWLQFEFPNPTRTTGATIYWDSKTSEENVYRLEYSRDSKSWKQVPGAGCSREKTTVREAHPRRRDGRTRHPQDHK